MSTEQGQIVTVGVTGASGAILAQKTLAMLDADSRVARIHLVVTETGQRLFAEELGISSGDAKQLLTILPAIDPGAICLASEPTRTSPSSANASPASHQE